MTEKKTAVLRTLRDTLRFHKAMGIEEYPNNQDVQRFMEVVQRPKDKSSEQPGNVLKESLPLKGIANLENEIKACTLCQLSKNQLGRIPGKGKIGCRLMIVGDWSAQSGIFSSKTLFGKEEDIMFWKMMTAISLSPDQVYVTNSLKCCPTDPGVIDGKCEESCFSFLAREVAAVNPQIICAMGDMPVRALMGRKDPLARLRGRFGKYRYQSSRNVMVMPTFHPRFLLQQQELKKATWNDLLTIKRQLDEF
jgi:uracil-DNA glycosylase family 4